MNVNNIPDNELLKQVLNAGFKPIGFTVMMCEETFIFKSNEDALDAWEKFKPQGWWYGFSEFLDEEKWYAKEMLNNIEVEMNGLDVHWLDPNFAPKPPKEY